MSCRRTRFLIGGGHLGSRRPPVEKNPLRCGSAFLAGALLRLFLGVRALPQLFDHALHNRVLCRGIEALRPHTLQNTIRNLIDVFVGPRETFSG